MKMAILGAGNIASIMASTIVQMEDIEPYAVAARDKTRAEQFAKTYGFAKAYGSYEELVNDPDVQLVYIATPHSHHAQHAALCLQHNKPVLCEKAFTATAQQAKSLVALSKQHNVFLTEAIWTRYMPMAKTLKDLVDSGIIGTPNLLTAGLGYPVQHNQRMRQPELAGGALLDLGVYPITFSSIIFGNQVKSISSSAVLFETGVDAVNSIAIDYGNGRLASLTSNMCTLLDRTGKIYGDGGWIEVDNINNFEEARVYTLDGRTPTLAKTIRRPQQISGYEYEVQACVNALREGRIECEEMPHAESVRMMELMDSLRHSWGVRYPFE
ncbi:Gfo/Idh/MocA family oxidoreductase [Ruminococcaceae bacterium OttesenSCG-928-A16]|nr:Gfo/Idh/MocA family oxidoreductase [Ruminococcaceae bacterium OttesenSCG-928-A16]